MVWLPDSEQILMICLFVLSLTEFMNVTDTHTQTPRDNIGHACIESRGINHFVTYLLALSCEYLCPVFLNGFKPCFL